MRPTSRSRRLAAAIAVGLALIVGVAGCGTIRAFTDLQGELDRAGFNDISVNVGNGGGGDAVALVISVSVPDERTVETAQTEVARIAWTTFPRRFDELRLSVDGNDVIYSRAELEQRFGDRPGGLDDEKLSDDINRIGIGGLIGLAVGGLLCLGIVGLVVFLLVRRRPTPVPPGGPPAPWMPVPAVDGPAGGQPPGDQSQPSWGPPPPGPPPPGPPSPGPSAGDEPPPPGPTGPVTPDGPPPTPPSSPTPPTPAAPRSTDPHARRIGRRPRGPVPPPGQTPPGWG